MSPRTVPRRVRVMSTLVGVLLVTMFLLLKLVGPYTDWLWFGELGQTSVFFTILRVKTIVFFVTAALVGALVFAALWFAYRNRPMFIPVTAESPIARYRAAVESSVRLFGIGMPIVIGVLAGFLMQANWPIIELYLHGSSFGAQDPQFHHDLSFYVFDLPFYVFVLDTLEVVAVVCFSANLITHYLFDGVRPSRSSSMLTRAARVQLAVIAGIFFLLKAVGYWFDQYELLFNERKVQQFLVIGGYTDMAAVLPAKLVLTAIAMICAAAFFSAIVLRDLRVPALATVLMLLSSVLIGMAWPATVQWLTATPNAREVEHDYIKRSIEATKQAFKLTEDDVHTVDWAAPQNKEEFAKSVQEDTNTLTHLRVLDPNLLAPTFTQLQRSRSFYGFPSQLALDRYMVDGQLRDYIVAVRELSTANLTPSQTNWQNRHLVYTHGNGFVAAPANQVNEQGDTNSAQGQGSQSGASQGGLPVFTVSDLSTKDDSSVPAALRVSEPRVYYGPLIAASDPDYAIVGGPAQEYDQERAPFYSYRGTGGVPLGSFTNRLAFTLKYWELNFFRSEQITDSSRLLFVRNPRERVAKLAPWLTLDEKTYPAVVDGRIQWIVDGYTTLAQFPYAKPVSLRDATLDAQVSTAVRQDQLANQVSYIRNSVKATVDAYDGTVTLYQQDDKDPVLKAWMGVFPGLVKPKSEIKPELAQHFRYPEDLFKVQRELLTRYHVDNPTVFFDQTAVWSVPLEPAGIGQSVGQANQPPYYMVASDPDPDPARHGRASFQLTTVMTPQNQQYLAAHISVASDPDDYGKIYIKQLPPTPQIPGPNNVANETRPTVSNDIGPRVNVVDPLYGNLLTVPVGRGGLLYLEPIYFQVKSRDAAFPLLYKVVVYFDGKIGFQSNVAEALQDALRQAGINVDLRAVVAPQQQTLPPAAVPDPAQSAQPPTGSQTKQEAQTRLQQLGQALDGAQKTLADARNAVDAAKSKLDEAQKSGDFVRIGQALADQQKAMASYGEAVQAYQTAVDAFRKQVVVLATAPN